MRAVEGKKLEKVKPRRTAARAIVFTPRRMRIKVSPTGNPFFGDIPVRGEIYDRDFPLVSVFATGGNYYEKLLSRRDLYFKMQGVKL